MLLKWEARTQHPERCRLPWHVTGRSHCRASTSRPQQRARSLRKVAVCAVQSVEAIEVPGDSFGTKHSVAVYRFGAPGARPKVYLQGGLHADEIPPILVLHHLRRKLGSLPTDAIKGEIIVVPSCNPIGLSQVVLTSHVGRYHAASGLNFNRKFPDTTAAAAAALVGKLTASSDDNAELLRRALAEAASQGTEAALRGEGGATADLALKWCLLRLAADADIVLDLHSDSEGLLHMYTSDLCWPEASDLAAAIKAQSVLIARDAGGDPFDDACLHPHVNVREMYPDAPFPKLGVLSVTIEYRGQDDVDDEVAEQDAEGLVRFLEGRGVIERSGGIGADPPPSIREGIATQLSGVQQVRSPRCGIILWKRSLGDTVTKGALLAELLDPTVEDAAQARCGIFAETAGLFFARSKVKLARAGDVIGKVAGRDPLPGKAGGLLLQD